MQIGDYVKVRIPGETPWVEVMTILADGRFLGRFDSQLIGSADELTRQKTANALGFEQPLPKLHDHKLDELALFQPIHDGYAELVEHSNI